MQAFRFTLDPTEDQALQLARRIFRLAARLQLGGRYFESRSYRGVALPVSDRRPLRVLRKRVEHRQGRGVCQRRDRGGVVAGSKECLRRRHWRRCRLAELLIR